MGFEPILSVIIPTKDRASVLGATLTALSEQTLVVEGEAEIVVADNGSADRTPALLRELGERLPHLTALAQPRGGPAAARNAAATAARGKVLLLLGDDTAPAGPDLLSAHAALHREQPDPTYACLGRIEWTPRPRPTEFMRWLDSGGPQFHYWELSAGDVDPSNYFYSSHLSLKRSLFKSVGGFDERFPFAAVEDTDLGTRLGDRGVSLDYRPELVVLHNHPTSLATSLRRTRRVGRCAALYNSLHPGEPHPRVRGPRPVAGLAAAVAAPVLAAAAHAPVPKRLRERIWSLAHRSSYAVGYRQGPP
jgi:GT2 family glycosyltransferase